MKNTKEQVVQIKLDSPNKTFEEILTYLKEFKITPDTKYQFRYEYRHKWYPERLNENID